MSVQFGRLNFDAKPVDLAYLEKVRSVISPYGPDGCGSYLKDNISVLYHAFHTTKESRRETQPYVTASGVILTWDGRLDNRAELIRDLSDVVTTASTDVVIAAAAYEHWGNACFAMLIGDWALSIWNPHTRSLLLAKDPIGTRHLYYAFEKDQVSWSTVLDPLILFAGRTFELCEEYIAGWFSLFPATHLTPYAGVQSVPPSSFVLLRQGTHTVNKYWDFDPGKQIRYRTDREYEEHFRVIFREAVRRRLRSDSPTLAELSGGMDSSSIVCVADTIIARGEAETPLLDTVSYYNDSEPNWNERPYFTKVEEKRGRTGTHIDLENQELFECEFAGDRFLATPDCGGRHPNKATREFAACLISGGYRVVLSGIGGDEVMGGVPTPTLEFEDLLANGDFRMLAHQLKLWALNQRKPWFHLFFAAARDFLPLPFVRMPKYRRPAPWLNQAFIRPNRAALQGYPKRLRFFGPSPSFQGNLATLDVVRRQLSSIDPPQEPSYVKNYPYLDRDLLQFVYGIPREQLVRPGQRRSLMRRALSGVVPDELLNRRRKAFGVRSPMKGVVEYWMKLAGADRHMLSASLGIVDSVRLDSTLQDARDGKEVPVVLLFRALHLEFWLQALKCWQARNPGSPRFFERTGRSDQTCAATGAGKVSIA